MDYMFQLNKEIVKTKQECTLLPLLLNSLLEVLVSATKFFKKYQIRKEK